MRNMQILRERRIYATNVANLFDRIFKDDIARLGRVEMARRGHCMA